MVFFSVFCEFFEVSKGCLVMVKTSSSFLEISSQLPVIYSVEIQQQSISHLAEYIVVM
jgi:hypothetical protein